MKYLSVVGLWVLVALLVVVGIIPGLLALLIGRSDYTTRVVRSTNRAGAAVLGWDGSNGISHECGKSGCLFCRLLCPILSFLLEEANHCEKEANRL